MWSSDLAVHMRSVVGARCPRTAQCGNIAMYRRRSDGEGMAAVQPVYGPSSLLRMGLDGLGLGRVFWDGWLFLSWVNFNGLPVVIIELDRSYATSLFSLLWEKTTTAFGDGWLSHKFQRSTRCDYKSCPFICQALSHLLAVPSLWEKKTVPFGDDYKVFNNSFPIHYYYQCLVLQ